MALTVCFLARNHAESIGRAVGSARGLNARILVADTGSTDATLDRATAAGAETTTVPWHDDFAAACNATLDRADGDWILWMNPDEELTDLAAVRSALADDTAFAFKLHVRQQLRPDETGTGTVGWEARLVRRVPELRYAGRVHPYFAPSLDDLAAARGQSIRPLEATIVRHAYLSTPTPDKMRWVVRLLEAERKDRPDRLGVTIELGRNLLWLNDPRGHELLASAASVVNAANGAHAPDPAVGALFEYLLNAEPSQVRTALSLEKVRALVPRWFGRTPPVLWAAAQERYRAGDVAAAAKHLDALLEIGSTGWYDSPGFDPDIIGVSAAMTLGACHLRLKNWLPARACFEHYRDHPKHGELARRGYAEADANWRANQPNV